MTVELTVAKVPLDPEVLAAIVELDHRNALALDALEPEARALTLALEGDLARRLERRVLLGE